jgi:hypothetical protein
MKKSMKKSMTKFCALLFVAFALLINPQRAGAESSLAPKSLTANPSRPHSTPLTRLAYCAYQGSSCSSDNDCCAGTCNSQHKCSK